MIKEKSYWMLVNLTDFRSLIAYIIALNKLTANCTQLHNYVEVDKLYLTVDNKRTHISQTIKTV